MRDSDRKAQTRDTTYGEMSLMRTEARTRRSDFRSYGQALDTIAKEGGYADWPAFVKTVDGVGGVALEDRMRFPHLVEAMLHEADEAVHVDIDRNQQVRWGFTDEQGIDTSITGGIHVEGRPEGLAGNPDLGDVAAKLEALVAHPPLNREHHRGLTRGILLTATSEGAKLSFATHDGRRFEMELNKGSLTTVTNRIDGLATTGSGSGQAYRFEPEDWGFEKMPSQAWDKPGAKTRYRIAGTGPAVDEVDEPRPSDAFVLAPA